MWTYKSEIKLNSNCINTIKKETHSHVSVSLEPHGRGIVIMDKYGLRTCGHCRRSEQVKPSPHVCMDVM